MRAMSDIPELAIVRIQSDGGPYRSGDMVSLAFTERSVGRLAPHGAAIQEWRITDSCVPEIVSAVVTTACNSYGAGSELTLSFIDPCIARIHAAEPRKSVRAPHEHASPPGAPLHMPPSQSCSATMDDNDLNASPDAKDIAAPSAPNSSGASTNTNVAANPPGRNGMTATRNNVVASPDPSTSRPGALVRVRWTPERVRRFISVVDRLFTVDRLGWYRHVLAMRLLVPDDITTSDERAGAELARQLQELRAAVAQTFGRPLLAVFMPNFSVDAEWLGTLDSPQAARALAALRDTLSALANDCMDVSAAGPDWTVSPVLKGDLLLMPAASLEALLPILIPTTATDPALGARLTDYRRTLVEAFGQTVRSAGAVRLGAMTEPHHALDDRLWQLVGAVGAAFGEFASGPQPMSTALAAQA